MDPQQTYLVGSGVLFLIILSPLVSVLATIVFGVLQARRKPPVIEILLAEYARKSELNDLRTDMRDSLQRIDDQLQEEHAGRSRLHVRIEKMQETLQGSIDTAARNTSAGFLVVERAIGRLEGEIKITREQ